MPQGGILLASKPGQSLENFTGECEKLSGMPRSVWASSIRKYCGWCDNNPEGFIPDSRLPVNTTGHLSHKSHTFVLLLTYTRVRSTENPDDPGNTPRYIKLPFLEMMFLPQCHIFSDIPEYSMKHFQQAWSGKPMYVNHDYSEEPVGQHLAGFLADAGGLPKNNDEESTYNGQAVKFYGFYSLAAIENEKIPWILQTLKSTKLENLDVSIGYMPRLHVDPQDIVLDKDGDEDFFKTRGYEKNFMPLECSFVARGNGACPGATVVSVYAQERVVYDSPEQRMAKTLVQDAKKILGIDWDLESVISKELRDICTRLHKKGKLPMPMKNWLSTKGLRVYMSASVSEAADKSLVGMRKNTIWYLYTRKNDQKMSAPENNPTSPPTQSQPQESTQQAEVVPTEQVQQQAQQPIDLQVQSETYQQKPTPAAAMAAGLPQERTFSQEPMDPIPDAEDNLYTVQTPTLRAEIRKIFALIHEGSIGEDHGKTLMYGLIAKDKREVRAKKYQESGKQKVFEMLSETASSVGIDFKSPKNRKLQDAINDPDAGEFLLKAFSALKNQPAPVAPVIPQNVNKQMSQGPVANVANVPVPGFAKPVDQSKLNNASGIAGGQLTVNGQRQSAPKTLGQMHSESLQNLARSAAASKQGPKVEALKFVQQDGVMVPIVPDGPRRRHQNSIDPASARRYTYTQKFIDDGGESEKEVTRNLLKHGSFTDPDKKTLPGRSVYGKPVIDIRPRLDLEGAISKYSKLGDGSIFESPLCPRNPSDKEDFSTVFEKGSGMSMPAFKLRGVNVAPERDAQ